MSGARQQFDHQRSPAYQELLADRAAEQAAADAQAAQAAANDPVKSFEQVANIEAEDNRRVVLNYRLTDLCLAQHGTVKHAPPVSDTEMRAVMLEFKNVTPSFINTADNVVLLANFVKRNELQNCLETYALAHTMLSHFACYPDDVEPTSPAPVVEAEVVLTPREAAAKKYHDDRTIVVVTDPATGQQFTEHALSLLSAVEERRLRRIGEGRIGNSNFETYLDVKTAQFERDEEDERLAREAQGQ